VIADPHAVFLLKLHELGVVTEGDFLRRGAVIRCAGGNHSRIARQRVWECLDSDQMGAVAIHVYLYWLGVYFSNSPQTEKTICQGKLQSIIRKHLNI
jgi:hypothetical protein